MSVSLRCYSTSLGCPKNRVDTERLLGSLGVALVPVESPDEAELVFINTCAFIQPATEESVRTIAQAIADIEELPKRPLLAVAGCLVGRYHAEDQPGHHVPGAVGKPRQALRYVPPEGVLQAGADADIVVYDPQADHLLRAEDMTSLAGYTPYEGFPIRGGIRQVWLRGRLAVEDGFVLAGPDGKYISRASAACDE